MHNCTIFHATEKSKNKELEESRYFQIFFCLNMTHLPSEIRLYM